MSPHFIHNALNAIAAFIRTDPDRARELLLEFADFTRRAFHGPQGEFATLADELMGGIPLPWLVLGAAPYPVLFALGLYYARKVETIDNEFTDLLA